MIYICKQRTICSRIEQPIDTCDGYLLYTFIYYFCLVFENEERKERKEKRIIKLI